MIPAATRTAAWAGPRGTAVSCAAMKSASLTSAACAGRLEMTQPSGRFHRCTCLCPSPVFPGASRTACDGCRFHTCRPVYRGFARIAATVRSVHPSPGRCRFLAGSAADGHGTPASFSALVILAADSPASRCANIHDTTGAVSGSGSSRCADPATMSEPLDARLRPGAVRENSDQMGFDAGLRWR
jgi:hypothetical protein